MMKKYVWLLSLTSLLITAMILSKPLVKHPSTEVSVFTAKTEPMKETVTCTGKIKAAEGTDVYVEMPCIAGTVNVQPGDYVKEGDILFTVDTEATKQVLAAATDVSPSLIPDDKIEQKVTAPVSGKVRVLNAAQGEAIDSDTPCATISQSDSLLVAVTVNENDLKSVAVGQTVVVSGVAFKKEGYKGVVTSLSSSARQKYDGTNSVTVVDAVITLSETDDSVLPGLTAKAKIQVGNNKQCLIVPYEYVLEDEESQEYVYVYKNGRAVKQIVKTGKELADGYEIVSGLSSGDQIIKNTDDIKKENQIITIAGQSAKETEAKD